MPSVPFQSYLRLTHTGLLANGRPNPNSILIPDMDTGYENQNRKTPVYVPAGGYIDVPLTSKVVYSAMQGAIAAFAQQGLITVSSSSYSRDEDNLGGAGTGITLSALVANNVRRVGNVFEFVINSGLNMSGFLVGERVTLSSLGGAFSGLNGTHLISAFTKGVDFVGPNPLTCIVGVPSVGAGIPAALHGPGVSIVLPDGMITHLYVSAGNAGGLGADVRTYISGDVVITGAIDPTKIVFSPTALGVEDKNVLAVDAATGALVFYNSSGVPSPVGTPSVADLTDGPGAPVLGAALKVVRVNAAGNAWEYAVSSGGGPVLSETTAASLANDQVVAVTHPAVPLAGAGAGAISFATLAEVAGDPAASASFSMDVSQWVVDPICFVWGFTFVLLDLGGGTYTANQWGTFVSATPLYEVTGKLDVLKEIQVAYNANIGSSAKAAVSHDGGATWYYYTGVAWATMDIAPAAGDWDTKGCELQSGGSTSGFLDSLGAPISEAQWGTLGVLAGDDLRVCFAFKTTDPATTPTLSSPGALYSEANLVSSLPIPPPGGGAGFRVWRDPVLTTRSYFAWSSFMSGYSNFRCQVRTG